MGSIEGIGRPGVAVPTTRAQAKVLGAPFVVPLGTTAVDAQPMAAAVSPAALGSMLALQEQSGGPVEDRLARRRGLALLQALAALQGALLAGQETADPLQRLAALAEDLPIPADKYLAALLSGIVLRARVELARRGF